MSDQDVYWCRVCDAHHTQERVEMLSHLAEHSLRERLDSLMETRQAPEVEANG